MWQLPGRVLVLVLVVEAAAVGLVAADVLGGRPAGEQLRLTALLVLLGVVHTEVATGVERLRRRVAGSSYFDLSSVWTFAAAALLRPALAAVVIGGLYAHLWVRVWRPARVPLYRHVYTTATVVLAAFAAHHLLAAVGGAPGWPDDLAGLGSVALAVLGYGAVNTVLVAAAILLSNGRGRVSETLGHWDDNVLELGTLSLGALAAIALVTNPWLVVLVLPPLLVLHRAVLVRQLEEAASTDGKTGLLTAAAWHARANREVLRAQRSRTAAGVLILDLDHFKSVNDVYGHLAGDAVLASVAGAVQDEVREHDLAGRFGGEEFVVLLTDLAGGEPGRHAMQVVAERIRRRVAELAVAVDTPDGPLTITGLSTSVGGAAHPADGAGLEQVLSVADAALYRAKREGRNRVRIAAPHSVPAPRRAPDAVPRRDPTLGRPNGSAS
ncbi:MAG TPA: GGDEF domain-containing protein [Pseudonocardia sp.]|nr:GGDEF domain-containing protein [Pseudonocardia sp.]